MMEMNNNNKKPKYHTIKLADGGTLTYVHNPLFDDHSSPIMDMDFKWVILDIPNEDNANIKKLIRTDEQQQEQ